MLEAVRQNSPAALLQYGPEEVKGDKSLVEAAVAQRMISPETGMSHIISRIAFFNVRILYKDFFFVVSRTSKYSSMRTEENTAIFKCLMD